MTHALKQQITSVGRDAVQAARKRGGNALGSIREHGGDALGAVREHGGDALDSAWQGSKHVAQQTASAVQGAARQVGTSVDSAHQSYVKKKQAASSAQSAFAKLAPALEMILPSEGSMCTVDVEFEIPVGKGVGFVGLHVTGTVAHGTYVAGTGSALSSSAFQVGLYAAVTGGAELHIAKAKFEAGAFLGTQGPTAAGALDIASWTLYRNLLAESSVIPKEIVEAMYGKKGQTAAEWDQSTQDRYFVDGGDDFDATNSGTIGVSAGGSASFGQGSFGKASVGAKVKSGRVYDAKSAERRRGAQSSTKQAAQKISDQGVAGISTLGQRFVDSKRGPAASLGDRALTFIGLASLEATGIASGTLTVTVVLRQVKDKRPGQKSSEWILASLMVDATAKSPGLDAVASLASGGAVMISTIRSLVESTKSAGEKVKEKLKSSDATRAGEAIESITNFCDGAGTALSAISGITFPSVLPGLVSTGVIHVAGGMQAKTMNLYIGFEKATSVGLDLNVLTANFEKIERVGSVEYDGKAWSVHFGDLEKEVKRAASTQGGNAPDSTVSTPPPKPVGLGASTNRQLLPGTKPLPQVPVKGAAK